MREVPVNSTSLYETNSFQSKASVVCSVTAAIFIGFPNIFVKKQMNI